MDISDGCFRRVGGADRLHPLHEPADASVRRATRRETADVGISRQQDHFMALRHATAENFKRYIDEDKLGDFVWRTGVIS